MFLLQITPGEDSASRLTPVPRHYPYEISRGHFYRALTSQLTVVTLASHMSYHLYNWWCAH